MLWENNTHLRHGFLYGNDRWPVDLLVASVEVRVKLELHREKILFSSTSVFLYWFCNHYVFLSLTLNSLVTR